MSDFEKAGEPLSDFDMQVQRRRLNIKSEEEEISRAQTESRTRHQHALDEARELLKESRNVANLALSRGVTPLFQLCHYVDVPFPKSLITGKIGVEFLMPVWSLVSAGEGRVGGHSDAYIAPSQGLALSANGDLHVYKYRDSNSGVLVKQLSDENTFSAHYGLYGFQVGASDNVELNNSAVKLYLVEFAANL